MTSEKQGERRLTQIKQTHHKKLDALQHNKGQQISIFIQKKNLTCTEKKEKERGRDKGDQ